MLKMLTADYCGTGRSFTRNGQPLRYEDADGWYRESPALDVADPVDAAAVEAIWTGDGALCLANPRLAAEEPLTAEEVARECERAGRPRPPRCTADDLLSWRARGHVLSAHPRPVRPRPESPGTPRPPVAR
jgi:hypothetical protein